MCRISDNDALVITSVPPGAFNSLNAIDPGTGWLFDGYSDDERSLNFTQSGAHLSVENTIESELPDSFANHAGKGTGQSGTTVTPPYS